MAKRGPREYPWFRTYVDVTRDLKLRLEPLATKWTWIAVLVLARRSPRPGRLLLSDGVPVTVDLIADEAHVTLKAGRAALATFTTKQMLHSDPEGVLVVTNWAKRQPESDRKHAGNRPEINGEFLTPEEEVDTEEETEVRLTPVRPPRKTSTEPDVTLAAAPSARALVRAVPKQVAVPKPHQAMIAALGELLGPPKTRGDWGKYATAAADLCKAGALPDSIAGLVDRWGEMFPDATCTPFALANNYATLTSDRKPRGKNGHRTEGYDALAVAYGDLDPRRAVLEAG